MRLSSVQIENFKSIRNITIPFEVCGQGSSQSNTSFFVGLNESGKSAILHAISLIGTGLDDIDYDTYCSLEAQEDDEYIDIFGYFELNEQDSWKKLIPKKFGLNSDVWEKVKITSFIKNVYKNKEHGCDTTYSIQINHSELPLHEYVITKKNVTTNGVIREIETIGLLSSINEITELITKENAKSFLKQDQKLLTASNLNTWILKTVESTFIKQLPTIQMWKSSADYLINEEINLNTFKEDPSISIPLKNVFHIFGRTSDEDIKSSIEKALKNQR